MRSIIYKSISPQHVLSPPIRSIYFIFIVGEILLKSRLVYAYTAFATLRESCRYEVCIVILEHRHLHIVFLTLGKILTILMSEIEDGRPVGEIELSVSFNCVPLMAMTWKYNSV